MTTPVAAPVTDDATAARVADVLGDAFLADPVLEWVLRGSDRQRRLTGLFASFVATARRRPGSLVLLADDAAASVWLPPGGWHAGLLEQARSLPAGARAVRTGAVRGLRVEAVMARAHLAEPHWYLHAVGARVAAQGTGVGPAVVQPVLDRCDDAGLPAYLESSNPRNYGFYERHGFVRTGLLPVPAGCPPLMGFRRPPR